MTKQYEIRLATAKDVSAVYEMAYQLAKMQELAERFCMNENALRAMLENKEEATTTIVAVLKNKIVGFAMYIPVTGHFSV